MTGRVVEFFEIVIPRCANTYGVAPCTASVPTTGDAKCFNCLATCQDSDNFVDTTATLRFAKPAAYLKETGIDFVGSWIRSIEHSSATISLAETLGTRAVLKVVLEDHPHSDAGAGLDPYQADRGYDPYERGTFWPRFRARYPSPNGFECAWYVGEVGQTLAEMEKRSFFVESFSGPGSDGSFTITAKDALKFLDGDRAQIPVLSEGSLIANINSSVTSFTITPTGIGADYPSSGYIRIAGKEDCSFTRSGDAFTITRAQLGTTAAAHSAGDRVQLVKRYASVAAADIIADAITNYTDLDPAYIPLAEWQLEDSTNLGTLYTFTLGEPVSVSTFVSRVLEQCGGMMWDDALEQQLRFRVIKAVPTSANVISEDNVINKTFDPSDQPEQRVSRVWVYHGINDPTKRRDDLDNYRQSVKTPDEDIAKENEALYGSQSIRKILADGIAVGGSSVATRIGNLLVGRKQRPPRRFKWSMLRRDNLPEIGAGVFIDWRSLQDASGARERVPVQIISAKWSAATVQYTAEEMRFTDLDTGSSTDRVLLINFDTSNINLRSIHDAIYPSTFGGGVTVTFIISSTIGSTSTGLPAVDVGDWSDAPPGLRPAIILTGRIKGKGGKGGAGGGTNPATNGLPGGTALYTRSDIDLDVSAGEIWSGGGGGGGGAGNQFAYGGGGGGGGGKEAGAGGLDGFGIASGSPGTETAGGSGSAGVSSGGNGGAPGFAGSSGGAGSGTPGSGGPTGAAIDGVSYVNVTAGPGDIRGSQIN